MNNSVSLMAVKDASGRYQFANPKFEQTFGFRRRTGDRQDRPAALSRSRL
jgi:PAS domain-containing protein